MSTPMIRTQTQKHPALLALAAATLLLTHAETSQAGVFNIPHFVAPKEFAIGVEPELVMGTTAGVGINLRYTQGISDLSNLNVILGTGSGPRNFRLGSAVTFDFFPDVEGQPGIGLALQGLFVQLPAAGSLEISAIPYLHKTFHPEFADMEPFVAFPLGLSLSSGVYQTLTTLVIGSLFHHNEHFSSVAELGVNITNTNTYISGGLVYRH